MKPTLITHLEAVSLTATTAYVVPAGEEFVFNLNGTGVWGYWDGAAYVDYTAGSGKNFVGFSPASGKIQVTRTSGTIIASFSRT
jgi:hypothetical protein